MYPDTPRVFEFSVFRFDAQSGELLRNGGRLRTSEQAARILTALLENAGSVVSRDELRNLLWPNGEFVDYDHSINNAVSQLRVILRINAKTPSLIETIPKRGYRLVGDVKVVSYQPSLEHSTVEDPATATTKHDIPSDPFEVSPESREVGDIAAISTSSDDHSSHKPRPRLLWAAACLAILLIAVVAFAVRHQTQQQNSHYIYMGVAPFEVSGTGSEELAESFRMDLTDSLSQLPTVRVHAGHSFTAKKQDDANLRSLAQTLGLDTLVFGRFSLQGNQCSLELELVRGRDATHLATLRYSGTKDELGTIRDRAQRDIFSRLALAGDATKPLPGSTANPRAYEAYLRGRYYLSQWRDEPLKRAVREFETAINEDPGFAKAYAGMASAYMVMADHAIAKPEESYQKADELATKAVQMDSSLAEGHAMIGYVALHKDWNFEVADKELHKAVELDPGQAVYHLWLAQFLTLRGRFDESLQQVDQAHSIDPFWAPVYMTEIYTAYAAQQHARALKSADKMIALMPDWPLARNQRGWLFWYSGHYQEAIADWRQMAVMEKDNARIELEDRGLEALQKGGVRAYARLRLDAIKSHSDWAHALTDFVPAEWYVYAGERDKALVALEDLVDRRDLAALQMAVNPAYSDLYTDPKFKQLLARVGLSQPQGSRAGL